MKIKTNFNKEINTSSKAPELSSLNTSVVKNNKHTSKHTKSSTSHTIQSFHIGLSSNKCQKTKKSLHSSKNPKQMTSKQNQILSPLKIKKRKQKSKHKISLNKESHNYNQSLKQGINDDFEQYCLVQNSFVPITTKGQSKKLEEILKSTADSTPFYEDFSRTTARKVFPFKLKESMHSIFSQSSRRESQFRPSKAISKKSIEIEASPLYEEIGIQYSQRASITQIKNNIPKAVEIDIQTDFIDNQQKQKQSPCKIITEKDSDQKCSEQQSLSDLLIKLQLKNLANQKQFQNLSKMEKQHYFNFLTELLAKINVSPRSPQKNQFKTKQKIQIQDVHFAPIEEIKIKYEKMQIQAYKRQCTQLNIIQKPFNPEQSDDAIDTSLLAISTFLFNFFCYIDLNYSEQFLNMMKKQYGPTYRFEFQRLTRKSSCIQFKTLKVLDENLFQDFCDSSLNEVSIYEKIHHKSVFDLINDLLDTYRPFYNHDGEPFPWSVKMYHNICQYAFDEDSLQIIFGQIKQTIQTDVQTLCGIYIDEKFITGPNEKNLLQMKRNQKQNNYIQNWLKESTHQNRAIECQATKTIFEVSELIYNELLLQILQENPLNLTVQTQYFQFIE